VIFKHCGLWVCWWRDSRLFNWGRQRLSNKIRLRDAPRSAAGGRDSSTTYENTAGCGVLSVEEKIPSSLVMNFLLGTYDTMRPFSFLGLTRLFLTHGVNSASSTTTHPPLPSDLCTFPLCTAASKFRLRDFLVTPLVFLFSFSFPIYRIEHGGCQSCSSGWSFKR